MSGILVTSVAAALFSMSAIADGHTHSKAEACGGYGPQTPRDIDSLHGENKRAFSLAPDYENMNLCNIHFHHNAEHKAKDFSIFAGEGSNGVGGGYMCAISQELSEMELRKPAKDTCNGLKPGDTIEVHYVHSSCDVTPGPTLGSCLSESCANPNLRVETQVFTLVNDSSAMDFAHYSYDGNKIDGFHQAKSLDFGTGAPVEFTGSTTGPSYTEESCSPMQVSWSVRPRCAKVDINTVGKWCESNVFAEDSAHGVRKLVVNPALLSEIE